MQVRRLTVRADQSGCQATDAEEQLDALRARADRDERAAADSLARATRQADSLRSEVDRLREELRTAGEAHDQLKIDMAAVLGAKGEAEVRYAPS